MLGMQQKARLWATDSAMKMGSFVLFVHQLIAPVVYHEPLRAIFIGVSRTPSSSRRRPVGTVKCVALACCFKATELARRAPMA